MGSGARGRKVRPLRTFGWAGALIAAAAAFGGAKLAAPAEALSWSMDGRYVLAAHPDLGGIRLDTRGKVAPVPEGLDGARLSPDGRLVLGARERSFVAVDLETLASEETPMPDAQGRPVTWARGPFGDVIVTRTVAHYSIRRSGGRSTDADAAPTKNFRELWLDPTAPLAYVDTSYGLEVRHLKTGLTLRLFDDGRRDQQYVGAVLDGDGRIVLGVRDADGFRVWAPPEPPGPAWDLDADAPVSLGGDGGTVAVGGDGGVRVYAARTQALLHTVKTRSAVVQVALAPDGTHVAAALADGSVRMWPLALGAVDSPAARADAKVDVGRIAAETLDGEPLPVRRAPLQHGLSGATTHVGWAPSGHLVGWVGGALTDVNPTDGTATALSATGEDGRPIAWSVDGKLLATVVEGGVAVHETRRYKVVRTLPTGGGHQQLQWRGGTLVVDAGSGRASAWDPSTGTALGAPFPTSVDGTARFVLSPDGAALAVTGRTPIVVGSTDGTQRARLGVQWGGVVAAAWSPDGRRLATAGADSTVVLWDTSTWTATTLVEGAHGRLLAFSPDGRRLVSASWDGALVADVAEGRVVERLAFDGLLATVDWSDHGLALVDAAGSVYVWP